MDVELPLPPEEAQKRLQEMGATIMFEKVLTASDTSGTGRVVIPKTVAETNFPSIENDVMVEVNDVFGKKFSLKYRFWTNNASRMYLVEGTQELLVYYKLAVGDVLVFARLPSAQIIVCGRKGTKEDSEKPRKAKRTASGTRITKGKGKKRAQSQSAAASADKRKKSPDGGGGDTAKTSPMSGAGGTSGAVEDSGAVSGGDGAKIKDIGAEGTSAGDGLNSSKAAAPAAGKGGTAAKSKKSRQQKQPSKRDREGVNSMYEYWNGVSLPARRDGVFRAVPATIEVVPDKVTAQQGHWTAVVNLGGELYQAFFDSRDAAVAAYNAAIQN